MFKRLKERFYIKTDNKGSAIIVVILAVAFVGMLVAMLAYMTVVNIKMKYTDRGAKDNFYSAESALDEINVGLQSEISMAMTNAYAETMKSAAKQTETARASAFKALFRDEMSKKINPKDASDNPTPALFIAHLESFWLETPKYDSGTNGSYGADLSLADPNDPLSCRYVEDSEGEYITLKGIHITFTDEDGFVSIIQTDIVIEVPDINYIANTARPELQMYSLVANNSLVKTTGLTSKVAGSVYGGKTGINVENPSVEIEFGFMSSDLADDATPKEFVVVANEIKASNGGRIVSGKLTSTPTNGTSGKHEIWAQNITADTAKLDLDGQMYVQDDLNLEGTDYLGHGSNVKLSGDYVGYGDATLSAKESSSILINGAKTTLDMSDLKSLSLAGHAYVGATHYDVNAKDNNSYVKDLEEAKEDEDNYYNTPAYSICPEHGYLEGVYDTCPKKTIVKKTATDGTPYEETVTCGLSTLKYQYTKNDEDISLGQSIAMKSDQLIYMVPTECMCYDNESGEQVLAKNPLTYDEYIKFTTTYLPLTTDDGSPQTDAQGNILYSNKLKYRVVDLGKTFSKMDRSLQATYGVSYKPVFRKVSGTVLVYYYLFFDTETQANQFFADYYEKDPATIQAYANSYIEKLILNPNLKTDNKLSLAGNLLTYNGSTFTFQKSTFEEEITDSDTYLQSQKARAGYHSAFNALCHYLLKNESELSAEQLNNDVYNNLIVNEEDFNTIVPLGTNKVFERSAGTEKFIAAAYNNIGGSACKVSDTPKASIIVASGDVEVDVTTFKGLIVAGGDIILTASCESIEYDSSNVLAAMMAKDSSDNTFYKLFRDGMSYANVTGIAGEGGDAEVMEERKEDYFVIGDLIQYDNWTKE